MPEITFNTCTGKNSLYFFFFSFVKKNFFELLRQNLSWRRSRAKVMAPAVAKDPGPETLMGVGGWRWLPGL